MLVLKGGAWRSDLSSLNQLINSSEETIFLINIIYRSLMLLIGGGGGEILHAAFSLPTNWRRRTSSHHKQIYGYGVTSLSFSWAHINKIRIGKYFFSFQFLNSCHVTHILLNRNELNWIPIKTKTRVFYTYMYTHYIVKNLIVTFSLFDCQTGNIMSILRNVSVIICIWGWGWGWWV